MSMSDEKQAELNADKLSKAGNEFDALQSCDILNHDFDVNTVPQVTQSKVRKILGTLKINKATVKDDVPAKVLKYIADEIAEPLTIIINTAIKKGQWPDAWKTATITPIPKEYPTISIDKLRGISGLFTGSKVAEKIIAEYIISDMKEHLDKSQFANQKGISAQHYLVKMVDNILKATDRNLRGEKVAVLLLMIDWKEAFDRQCPKLGVEAFKRCGVRSSLIPLLINYFQNRKIRVKWHGKVSETRKQNRGGPQGSIFGILEYLAQTNFNTDYLTPEEKYKFMDDLSVLEIINLLTIGMCSYNMKAHVASDVISGSTFIPQENLKAQTYLNNISEWTEKQKMKLNKDKTKQMIFNFTDNFQFSTRTTLNGKNIETTNKTKLLGVVIRDDLKWENNTKLIVKKANARMQLLQKCASFTKYKSELKNIYVLFVRSILEQSCVVWHSSITQEESENLERVQKSAIKIILQEEYSEYPDGLVKMNLKTS